MICLGNLRVESTISERIHQSLEGYSDSLALQSVSGVRELSMLCRRPAISSKKKTMSLSQNIIHYGVLTIKKREAQSELYRSLEKYGPRHPDVGKCYHSLGLLYLFSEAKKSKAEAITYLENSIRIYTNAMGVKHPDVASTLMLKGLAQLALERFDDSIASMLRVRRMREDTLGHRHPELGQILNNLACVQYELGDYRKAESLFQEALDLQREAFTTEPAFLNGVSKVLCNSAFLHAKSGSFPKALIELEGALQIKKDILFEDNSLDDIIYSIAHILAVQKLQHGVFNLEEITEEYITMLRTSTIR
jgi:tetratricopeptide (TPR) repeat protein